VSRTLSTQQLFDAIIEADRKDIEAGCPKHVFTRSQVVQVLGDFGYSEAAKAYDEARHGAPDDGPSSTRAEAYLTWWCKEKGL